MSSNLTTQQSGSDDSATVFVPSDEWIQQLEVVGSDEVADVAFDEEGNVYVSGTTEGDLGGTNAGGKDAWIAKYDPSGTRLWVRQWGTVDDDSPAEVAVDTNGNVYIVGQSGPGNYSTETDGFIIKYDSSGNQGWVKKIATSALNFESDSSGNREWIETDAYDSAERVAVDSAGNVYVTGKAGDLGAGAFEGDGLIFDETGPFLTKYNPNGDRLWLKQEADAFGVVSYMYPNLTVDGEDNVYLAKTDDFWESAPRTSIIKYDSSGNEQWNQNLDLQTNNSAAEGHVSNGIAVDRAGNVYVSGENQYVYWYYNAPDTENRAVLTKLDSRGDRQWQNLWSGSTRGVDVDRQGNVYVPVPQGINKYDPEGNLLWEQQFLSTFSPYSDIELDGDGRAYLAGNELEPWLGKLDVNIGESAIASKGLTLDEGASSTITSSQLEVSDPGDGNALTYVIKALPTNGSLLLNNTAVTPDGTFTQTDIDSGNLAYIHDGGETTKDYFSFSIAETTVDYGLGIERVSTGFPITVNPINDAPTDITPSNNNIKENSKAGKVIGILSTTDSDSDTHTYTLVENPGGRFAIEGDQLKVADGSKLDFEKNSSHTIKIRTTDNGSPKKNFSKEFAIELIDVEDNTVKSTSSHRLGATKQYLNLAGKDAINGTGNNRHNRIRGNNAKNRLRGKNGYDVLIGRGGNDVLIGDNGKDKLNGGNGNDNLNGGKGGDTMIGGAGNDTFVVDNVKDVIVESPKGGKDAVKSSISYGLPGGVENLTLTGKRDINGTGNNQKNRIVGNDGKNRLNGKGGSDVLVGGGGNDTLTGGGWSDRLIGNQGRDLLNGSVGNDTLTGGGGSDRFIFNTGKSYRQSSPGKDVIRDFKNRDNDKIVLDKSTFRALRSKAGSGFSVVAEFDVVKRDAAVANSDAAIVYNENNGKLFYDANGDNSGLGAGGVFAVLDNSPGLQANDFIIRA